MPHALTTQRASVEIDNPEITLARQTDAGASIIFLTGRRSIDQRWKSRSTSPLLSGPVQFMRRGESIALTVAKQGEQPML
ncbi:hypothetical protein KZJ38_00090 [Paraburkholderia edwinii]|uniref:Uncharacterized protein n=1 Tax=Paraburkholderia edwinii TaxID=2861782 RepID=A0ABX8UPC5_9BURK|nr:hypothetical protein [Paraburkholderia edwinii]QYD68844.1 hypothetical protein KZJ38_00090 [Paraburkholderia edwinii]